MSTFGMPGIGGSLGQCAICGETFLLEILTGSKITTFSIDDSQQKLCAHKKCLKGIGDNLDVLTLPEKSPLRQAYLRNNPQPQ